MVPRIQTPRFWRRSRTVVVALVCICFLAVACDSGNAAEDTGKGKNETGEAGKETGKEAPRSGRGGFSDELTAKAGGKGWEVILTTDRQIYETGKPVRLTLRFNNRSKKPLQLTFPSSKTHDLTAADTDGRIVWQWSNRRAFAQALQERTVLAGGSLTREVTWKGTDNQGDRVGAGDYEITGWFTAFDHDQKAGPLLVEFR